MYTRKTADEYHITANYGYGDGWETVCVEETFKLAKEQKKCYMENDPREYKIVKRRVKIEGK
jgi:hypothetical protein